MVKYAKSVPPRTQWAIERLAGALRSEGYNSAQVSITQGVPGHLSLFDSDGNQEFYMCQEGRWYALNEIEEG